MPLRPPGLPSVRPRARTLGARKIRYRSRARQNVGGVVGAGAGGTVKSGIGGGGGGSAFEILFGAIFFADLADMLEAATGAVKMFMEMNNLTIDNMSFKMFYRGTTAVLVVASFLATSKQVFGDPISCEVHMGTGIKDDVLNAFCWMYSTFSIPSNYKGSCSKRVQDPTALYNTYYQWVPIFLGLKGGLFCLPRLFWLMLEGGLIKFLTKGTTGKLVEDPQEKVEILVDAFHNHLQNKFNLYAFSFFLCEQLNLLVLIAVWFATDKFLNRQFVSYGPAVFYYYNLLPPEEREHFANNPMCEVFPRISACDFVRYGSAGLQENQNAICVLSLNMVNDKLFLLLWFWYALLTLNSAHRLFYRLIQIVWPAFRFQVLNMRIHRYLDSKARQRYVEEYVKKCGIGDWFVLYQLSRNMNKRFYTEFLLTLVDEQAHLHNSVPEIRIMECEDQSEFAMTNGNVQWASSGSNLLKNVKISGSLPDTRDTWPDKEKLDKLDKCLCKKSVVVNRRGSRASMHSEIIDLGCSNDDYDE